MRNIIFKELKELSRDGRFKSAVLISCILLLLALITGVNQYQKSNQQQDATQTKQTVSSAFSLAFHTFRWAAKNVRRV